MNHIFISFRSLEIDFAEKLAARLVASGYPIWMDRYGGILPGDDYRQKLAEGVYEAIAFVPGLSRNYVESKWCTRELGRADALEKPIIPAKIGEMSPQELPLVLENHQFVDFSAWEDDAQFDASLNKLLQGIKEQTGVKPGEALSVAGLTPPHSYRDDVEDLIDQDVQKARTIESCKSFDAIEAEEIRKDMELVKEQYRLASLQYRLTVNMADLPKLEAQKATYKAHHEALQQKLAALI